MNATTNTTTRLPLLRLASRASPLAQAQTLQVCNMLGDIDTEIVTLSTTGDEVLDRPLVEVGGKGVFIKTLEAALLDGRADLAVHSAKDMEADYAAGTEIAAFLPREDVRDALVGPYNSLDALPQAAIVGTASVRRSALLHHHRPDLQIKLLRGNVNSRLKRLEAGEFDAIILAVAGIRRLNLDVEYTPLSTAQMPPAAAQGALAIQIASGTDEYPQIKHICAEMNCADTADCVIAERAALAWLDGSCQTPISALGVLQDKETVYLEVTVLSSDGGKKFSSAGTAPRMQAKQLGQDIAKDILKQCGGRDFLA